MEIGTHTKVIGLSLNSKHAVYLWITFKCTLDATAYSDYFFQLTLPFETQITFLILSTSSFGGVLTFIQFKVLSVPQNTDTFA